MFLIMVCGRYSITDPLGMDETALAKAKDIASSIVAMTTILLQEKH
jgi:hypothetical protein